MSKIGIEKVLVLVRGQGRSECWQLLECLSFRKPLVASIMAAAVAALDRQIELLPRDRPVVAYCRGPYCVLSVEAAAMLRAHRFDARRLEDGYPEWRAAGHEVVV